MMAPRDLLIPYLTLLESLLVKTIFGSIQPKMAVITTPNGEFNDYWATMPHGKYRHPDHRFEWTRNEFKTFVESVLEQYPEYSVTYDGIVRVSAFTSCVTATNLLIGTQRTS